MDKQNVILKTHELEVIGQGGMVYEPCQIGAWWVMPADQYTGTIPPEIQEKWDKFKALNIPVLGYLIADDLREELQRREKETEAQREREDEADRQRRAAEWQQRKEDIARTANQVAQVGAKVAVGVGRIVVVAVAGAAMLTVGIIGALLRFDPILIAVLSDGRWVCLGAWWD